MKLGIDIGGTKCALVLGDDAGICKKVSFATTDYAETLDRILAETDRIGSFDRIGVSCGGPLDSARGVIQSPPNLPGWDDVPIVSLLEARYGVPARLCNDANACALAEWKFGAGVGTKNMIFLTFGTGMGAGLILNGRLYEGTTGMAGEIGHVRMEKDGPVGYGKRGSFEGFCSGGGLKQLGGTNAKTLAERARQGDEEALAVFRRCGEKLGEGLAILIDVLDPERIVIGSIFARAEDLLRPAMEKALHREALALPAKTCQIVPAKLGDSIGDYAALAVADGIGDDGKDTV